MRNVRKLVIRASVGISIISALVGVAFFAIIQGYVYDPAAKLIVARSFAPNFGEVSEGVFRSGQMTPPFLGWVWSTYRFRTVIHLAWSGRPTDLAEEGFLSTHNVIHRRFSWSPDGPPDSNQMRQALDVVDHDPRPILIHCRAGRDRTGGLVGYWRLSHGFSLEEVKHDWLSYGIPSPGWRHALEEASKHPPAGQ